MTRPTYLLSARSNGGFTLVELLVVIAIITVLSALAVPAISALKNAGTMNGAVVGISLQLNQARSYAMAHNTYVWIGIASPQADPTTLYMGTVAGTTGSPNDILNQSSYTPISKIQIYPNFNVTTASDVEALNTKSSWVPADDVASQFTSSTLSTFTQAGGGLSVTFPAGSVLQFDPQGEASISSTDSLPHWIQLGLKPIQGSSPNVAVIQVAGLSGQVQIFRP